MEKKIKHFSNPAEEFLKQQEETIRKSVDNAAEVFKDPDEIFKYPTGIFKDPAGRFKDPAEEFKDLAGRFKDPAGRFKDPAEVFKDPSKLFKDLLNPINYLEEQVKAMNIAVLGKDYFNITTFSAIRAIEEQFDFIVKNSTSEQIIKTPLYDIFHLEDLKSEKFETEEEWRDEIEEILSGFLKQLFENLEKSGSNIVHYIAIHHLELFAIFLAVYFFTQSASKQDIEVIDKNVDNIQKNVSSLHEEITQPDKINPEKNEFLENKLNRLIEALVEKFQKEWTEFDKNIPSEEKITLYKTVTKVEVKAEPNTDSSTITMLAMNEPVKWVAQEQDWIQIQFFDYIYWELKTGWIQEQNLELLTPSREGNSSQLTVEQEKIEREQILQVHHQIIEKYQTAFQRLANS